MEIKLVVFDLAGTTVKHKKEVHQAFIDAFEKKGVQIDYDTANEAMGKSKPVAIREILEAKKLNMEWIDSIHEQFLDNIITYYQKSPEVEEADGTSEIFSYLQEKGIKIGIDSGFDRETTDVLMEALPWGKMNLIDDSVVSDEVENGRPAPDMIFQLMENLGIESAEQVMKVGDTPVDLLEGQNAGCKYVIGVTSGAFEANELMKYPHTHLIKKLEEIKEILQSAPVI